MTTTLLDADGNPPTVRRGTSPTMTFAIKNADGTAKNLTGATEASFAVARAANATTRLLLIELGNGVSHDGDAGNVSVTFTDLQTEALPPGPLWCELWITDFTGLRDLPGAGSFIVYDSLVTVP